MVQGKIIVKTTVPATAAEAWDAYTRPIVLSSGSLPLPIGIALPQMWIIVRAAI